MTRSTSRQAAIEQMEFAHAKEEQEDDLSLGDAQRRYFLRRKYLQKREDDKQEGPSTSPRKRRKLDTASSPDEAKSQSRSTRKSKVLQALDRSDRTQSFEDVLVLTY